MKAIELIERLNDILRFLNCDDTTVIIKDDLEFCHCVQDVYTEDNMIVIE